jgi:rod shape determining protein RodA
MTTLVTPRKPPAAGRRNSTAAWRFIDVTLVASVLALSGFGLLMVYSATRRKVAITGGNPYVFVEKQAVFVALGIAVMIIISLIDYQHFRSFGHILYGATILLLAALIPLGSTRKGTQAWFQFGPFQLQPSEFAKITMIICVALYLASVREDLDSRRIITCLALIGLPLALIYLQPDLGTSLVFIAFLFAMLLVAGARSKHLIMLAAIGVLAIVTVLQLGVLKQYQVDRLTAFLDSSSNTRTSTYNLNQSKIAIGSGGLHGKGLFQGTQTNLSYVPEQQTDFIFTVVGEELGFIGSATLLSLFGIVIWRVWRTAALARDSLGTLLCVGVLGMFMFQIFENVGMTMGIMPITGIPLPFMSYGGSAIIACFAAIGIVLNVHMRRFR